jgi:hypothetical protein
MAITYAVSLAPFIKFDGTNIQEIYDNLIVPFSPGAVIDGTDRIYYTGTGSDGFDYTYTLGDVVAGAGGVIPAEQWARYLKFQGEA